MSTTTGQKKEGSLGGPPSEEERRQFEAKFKQAFLDEYHKRHGDSLISAKQIWELHQVVEEIGHAKMKELHGESRSLPPHEQGLSPGQLEEKRKQVLSELQEDFQKNFTATHGTAKVSAEQALSLIQKVQHKMGEKLEADRQKHGR